MTPAERRAGMDIAALGGLRHAGSLDHRLGVIEPALLFAQSRHRRLGQGVEGAPAALAAIARHSVRPAPGDDLPPAAVGATPAFDLAMADSPQRVLPNPALRGPSTPRRLRRPGSRLPRFARSARVRRSAFIDLLGLAKRFQRLSPLGRAQPCDPGQPILKLRALHPDLRELEVPRIAKPTANAISAK